GVGARAIAAPKSCGSGFGQVRAGGTHPSAPFVERAFTVPARLAVTEWNTQGRYGRHQLLTNVQTVGQLAAKNRDVTFLGADFDDVFAAERRPIRVASSGLG